MRSAVEEGDVDELGAMLRDAFVAKRRMNPHIAEHTPIEAMLSMAQAAGANGGKICGAGGGGYLLLYCRPSAQAAVREELERLGAQFAPFAFRAEGVRAFRGEEVWAPTREPDGEPTRSQLTMDVEATTEQARRYLRATADTVRGVEEECLDDVVVGRHAPRDLAATRRQAPHLRQRRQRGGRPAPRDGVRQHVHDRQPPPVDPGDRAHHRHVAPHRHRERLRCRGRVRASGGGARPGGRRADRHLDERQLRERDPRGRTRACARAPRGRADGRVGRRSRGTGRCGRSRPQHRHGAHPGMSPGGRATLGLARGGCAVPSFRTSTRTTE